MKEGDDAAQADLGSAIKSYDGTMVGAEFDRRRAVGSFFFEKPDRKSVV